MSLWMRQLHRWLLIIFTLTVVANFALGAIRPAPAWLTYALLLLMLLTGLYLFALPYAARRRIQGSDTC